MFKVKDGDLYVDVSKMEVGEDLHFSAMKVEKSDKKGIQGTVYLIGDGDLVSMYHRMNNSNLYPEKVNGKMNTKRYNIETTIIEKASELWKKKNEENEEHVDKASMKHKAKAISGYLGRKLGSNIGKVMKVAGNKLDELDA